MKKRIILYIEIVISLVILGGMVWVFRAPLLKKIQSHIPGKTVSQETTQPVGVPRTISYLGRIQEAEKLIDNGYFSLATLELKQAIEEKPNLISPYLLLGEAHLRGQELDKLGNLVDMLRTKFPGNPEIDVLAARKLIAEKKFAEASALLDKQGNLSASLKFYQAVLAALQNDHKTAKKILEKLDMLPTETREMAVDKEGLVEKDSGDAANSISPEFAKKVSSLNAVYNEFDKFAEGKNPHLFALISKSLSENNEATLAFEFAEVAIKEDIQYIDAWVLRGYANFLLQKYQDALTDLRHAYELDPIRPETHYFLALTLEKLGQDEEAALFFEKSLEHNFEFSSEVRWKLIKILTKQKKFDRVMQLYRELVSDDPDPKEFVSAVHTTIDVLKKPEVALEITSELIAQNPNDVLAMNLHAWALVANKKLVEAEQLLKKAEKLNPTNPRTFLNFGLLNEKQGKFSEAQEFYKKSYELGKNQPFDSVTNLAAEKYNQLIQNPQKPTEPEAPTIPANSP